MKVISPTKEPIKIGITLQCNPNPIGHFPEMTAMQSPNAAINLIIRRQTIRIGHNGLIMSKDPDNPDQTIILGVTTNRNGRKGQVIKINRQDRKTGGGKGINCFLVSLTFMKIFAYFYQVN
jgi:hypothetical protein